MFVRVFPSWLVLLAACSSDAELGPVLDDTVTLTVWAANAPPASPDGLVFAGTYSQALPVENPVPSLGTNHADDPDAQALLDAYAAATAGAMEIRVHRGSPPTEGALYVMSGCEPNPTILDELNRLGTEVCRAEDLGRSITFANVQLARIAPNGPYHVYEDYVVQTLPLFLETGACSTGAWLCDDPIFSGIYIPSYPDTSGIQQVSTQTSSSGPGGEYADATYADLRLGGVEVIVRHLIDISTITSP